MLTNKCSFAKRLSAFLIDLFLVLIFALLFDIVATRPMMNHFYDYQNIENALLVERVKCYLFVITDENYKVIADGDDESSQILEKYNSGGRLYTIQQYISLNEEDGSDKYLAYLTKFYNLIETDSFENIKNDSGYFIQNNTIFDDSVSEETRILFCDKVFEEHADTDVNLYKEGIIIEYIKETSYLYTFSCFINYGIASFIFLWIIPLCSKYRQSIGKRIMKLGVVNKFYIPVNALLLSARFLSMMLIEVLLSVYTLWIPFIASGVLVLVLKNGCCIHDFLSTSQVIDINEFEPFKNLKEYKEFIEEEKNALDHSLRKPYEN